MVGHFIHRFHQRTIWRPDSSFPAHFHSTAPWRSVSGATDGPPTRKVRQKRMTIFGKAADFKGSSFFIIFWHPLFGWLMYLCWKQSSSAMQILKKFCAFSTYHLDAVLPHVSTSMTVGIMTWLKSCVAWFWHALLVAKSEWRQQDIPENTWARRYVCTETFQVGVGHESPSGAAQCMIHCWINFWSSQCQFDPI